MNSRHIKPSAPQKEFPPESFTATGYSRRNSTVTLVGTHIKHNPLLPNLAARFTNTTYDSRENTLTVPVGEPNNPSANIGALRELVIARVLSLPGNVISYLQTVTGAAPSPTRISNSPSPAHTTIATAQRPRPAPHRSSPPEPSIMSQPAPYEGEGLQYTNYAKTKIVLTGHNNTSVSAEMRKYPGVRFTNQAYTIPPAHITEVFSWAESNNIPIQPELYSDVTTLGVASPTVSLAELAGIPVSRLPSITAKKQEKFEAMGIETIYDLLFLFPRRYVDRSTSNPIRFLTEGEDTGLIATVSTVNYNAGKRMLRIGLSDTTGSITATFFNSAWMAKKFSVGNEVLIYGKPERWKPGAPLSFTSPTIEHYENTSLPVIPIYPQSGKNGVTTLEIARAMKETLPLIPKILDPLPEDTTIRQHFPSRSDAIRIIHFPATIEEAERARKRLAFDELLRIQVAFAKNKHNRALEKGYRHTNTELAHGFISRLPYTPTRAQTRTIEEIRQNLSSPHPMHRLLQGDVGAGKAQPYTSRVLTPDGYIPLADITIGMPVINPTGEPSHITGIYPQGERTVWEILFTDGTKVECDKEHLWVARISPRTEPSGSTETKTFVPVRTTTHNLQRILVATDNEIIIPELEPGNPTNNLYARHKTVAQISEKHMTAQMCCISVSHLNKLYVTDNNTVTHNTTVAAYSLLAAVSSGHQAALMAPTEILAKQLYSEIVTHIDGLTLPGGDTPIRAEFFSNQLKGKRRVETLARLAEGDIHISVGTHALLTPDIVFDDLSLIVIDEQHRFGVEQRNLLKKKTKSGYAPDTLVMTATPIPRTSAMTVFGDLDISVLDELPPGRTPIHTVWYDCEPEYDTESPSAQAWESVLPRLNAGEQAFIVCPLVEESEKMQAASATETFEKLSAGVLAKYRLGLVHGQQKPAERDETMMRFKNGELDAIVATTVIEVGVNIPNATTIVILDPARFGISQLHQLRGRVGRGNIASQCVMIGRGKTPEARRRLTALCETTDGFELSEIDLELRGHGSLFGTSQSGMTDLKIADLREDKKILSYAQHYAQLLLSGTANSVETANWVAEAEYFLNPEMLEWLNKS